jgi:hydrolase, haloacid dehalogenase-like family protein
MIRMVNIDLDGTLLDKEGNVSSRTIETFKKAKEKDIQIVITTGRPLKSAITFSKELRNF